MNAVRGQRSFASRYTSVALFDQLTEPLELFSVSPEEVASEAGRRVDAGDVCGRRGEAAGVGGGGGGGGGGSGGGRVGEHLGVASLQLQPVRIQLTRHALEAWHRQGYTLRARNRGAPSEGYTLKH